MTLSGCFTLTSTEGVAELTLARPAALNTMVPEFWEELPRLVRSLDAAGETRVLILSSTGKHFTAGMDRAVFEEGAALATATPRLRERLRQTARLLQDAFSALEAARFPVLAAVQGGCIGGGLDMVCACDLRYATRDAFFCIQEINLGMMADLGTLQRLPKLLPEAVVRELAYTGDRLSAARAEHLGFVNGLCEDHAALLEFVRERARHIARHSPLAIAGSKEAVHLARDHPVPVALQMAALWQSGMFDPADIQKALAAGATAPAFGSLLPLPERLEK